MRKSRANSSSGEMPPSPSNKSKYRLVVLGAAGVGKTCIISRFLYKKFETDYKATVEEMHRGEYEIGGMPITLDILDTSGSYDFPAMKKLSISTGDAFVLVYSVQDELSFEEVKTLRQQIIDEKGGDELTPIVIVGNKAEVPAEAREVGKEVAESTASIEWGHGYVEASAKEDTNIVGIFVELLKQADFHLGETAAAPTTAGGTRRRIESHPPTSVKRTFSVRRKSQKRESSKQDNCQVS